MAYDPALAERTRSLLQQSGAFTEIKMFGGICFMVNGHMCCGVLKDDLMLRLAQPDVARALKKPHVRPMDFTRKPMKSMVYVNAKGLVSDEDLAAWITLARTHACSQPPKEQAENSRPRPS